jgi:hypothetical protein
MTEGNMTGRPYGGTNEPGDDDVLPGERPEKGQVGADTDQSPRAAQGGSMSTEDPSVPGSSGRPRPAEPPPRESSS